MHMVTLHPVSSIMDVLHCEIINLKIHENKSDILKSIRATREQISDITELLKCEKHRYEVTQEFLEDLAFVITTFQNHELEDEQETLAETYRCLRNSCAGCSKNQDKIHQYTDICHSTKSILDTWLRRKAICQTNSVTLRCIVQFLGNYTGGNLVTQDEVWSLYLPTFGGLLDYGDEKLASYTCMLVHSCVSGLLTTPTGFKQMTDDVVQLCVSIIAFTTQKGDEWGIYVIEDILQIPGSLKAVDSCLGNQERLFLLEVLLTWMERLPGNFNDDIRKPASANLSFLAEQWELHAYKILSLTDKAAAACQSSLVIIKQLEVICEAATHENLYLELRENTDLVTITLHLLSSIQQIGKQGENDFTNIAKISETDKVDPTHVAFGLKKDLIRLLANLCHKNKPVQDKIRDMEGIPLILDKTNIDARNPFITQWAIVAVHNLCEDNDENKAVFAGLKRQGMANNVEALRDFGVEAELKEDKIVVKSSRKE